MSSTEKCTGQKGPLLADEPLVILDEIGVCEDGIEGKEGQAVEVGVPRNGNVETSPFNLRRVNSNPKPI